MANRKRASFLGKRGYFGYRTRVELVREGLDIYEPVLITKPADVYDFMKNIRKADRESFYSIMMDSKNKVIGCEEVAKGQLNTCRIMPREIYKSAISSNACGIIATHNHPSGDPTPSCDDKEFTKLIKKGCDLLGIELYDSVIIGDGSWYSFKEMGEI